MPSLKDLSVADLGCGTGRFAKLLKDRGWLHYWGVDFSRVRIEEAKRYVPDFEFSCNDLLSPQTVSNYNRFQVFVLLEVLEHIQEDMKLLQSIPRGAVIIFSVPNFDDHAHVRWFPAVAHILGRYGGLLDFNGSPWITLQDIKRPGTKIFLCRCLRRN